MTFLNMTGGLPLEPGLSSSPGMGAILSQRSVGLRPIVPSLSTAFTRRPGVAPSLSPPESKNLGYLVVFGIGSK
jgi:hypothetical protein